jgi:proton-dependent oligopeptide transporter, POT family
MIPDPTDQPSFRLAGLGAPFRPSGLSRSASGGADHLGVLMANTPSPFPAAQTLPPDGPSGRTVLGHPPGLFLLFMVEMWERFSFYGMRAILGLYLKCKVTGMDPLPAGAPAGFNPGRGWTQAEASNLTGWYGGMAYLLPIAGGFIADKLIGTHRSMLVGGLLIALGHITLGISGIGTMAHTEVGMSVFIFGLALVVIGTGHFKPSVSVMVNQLYPAGDSRQQGAFGIFYMGINLGALLGTFFVGLVGERWGWHWGFTLAAIGMGAGLINYVQFRGKYLAGIGLPPAGGGKSAPVFVLTGIVLAAIVGVGFHLGALKSIDEFFSKEAVFYTILAGGLLAAMAFTVKQNKGDRGPVASIFIFMGFNFLFWLAFEQAATSINFFTDEKIDRQLGQFLVPTSWFQNINPFTIILLSPVFGVMWTVAARRKLPFPQPVKIGLGLIMLGLGYVFMVIAGLQVRQSGALATMWLILATYFLHTIGELFLSPTGLSYVSKAAPERHKSLLMGVWFLSSFLAYTVGGKLAGHADPESINKTRFFFQNWGIDFGGGYANFFFLFVLLSVGGGILIIALTPLLRKLMRDPND